MKIAVPTGWLYLLCTSSLLLVHAGCGGGDGGGGGKGGQGGATGGAGTGGQASGGSAGQSTGGTAGQSTGGGAGQSTGGSSGSGGGAGAPAGVSVVDDCGYTNACTEGSVTGHEFYCPQNYAKVPPATGCVIRTTGTLPNLHWCCSDPICSHFKSTDYMCTTVAGKPHDYSCAPNAPAAASCTDDKAGGFCCAF